MTDGGFNPARITTAIACLGWTRKELAARCGMAPARITELANGRAPFTETAARRVAFATGFPIGFFLMDDRQIPGAQLTFRRRSKMRKTLFTRLTTEFSLLIDATDRVSAMSGGRTDGKWLDAIAPGRDPSAADIERIALDVRACWGLPDHGPVRDMTRHIEKSGIITAPLSTPIHDTSGDGITRPSMPGAAPVIGYLPHGKTGDRIRFTMAHELGHLVLHRRRAPSDPGIGEIEANAFAGALLMPIHDAKAALTRTMTLDDYALVKAGWGVSIAALITRATRLGIIDDDRRRSLAIQMANRHWNRREPVDVAIEPSILLKQMMGGAFGDLADWHTPTVSRDILEGLLGLPFDMVNAWCDGSLIPRDGFDPAGA